MNCAILNAVCLIRVPCDGHPLTTARSLSGSTPVAAARFDSAPKRLRRRCHQMIDDRQKALLARTPDHVAVSTDSFRPIAVLSLSVRGVREKLGPAERGRSADDTPQTAARAEAEIQLGDDERDLGTVDDVHGGWRITGLQDAVPLFLERCAKAAKGITACLNKQDGFVRQEYLSGRAGRGFAVQHGETKRARTGRPLKDRTCPRDERAYRFTKHSAPTHKGNAFLSFAWSSCGRAPHAGHSRAWWRRRLPRNA